MAFFVLVLRKLQETVSKLKYGMWVTQISVGRPWSLIWGCRINACLEVAGSCFVFTGVFGKAADYSMKHAVDSSAYFYVHKSPKYQSTGLKHEPFHFLRVISTSSLSASLPLTLLLEGALLKSCG